MSLERLLRGRDRLTPGSVKSVLILEYYLPLGCCIHLTPVYSAIKQSFPEITLTVATSGIGYELLRHNPFVDHLILTPSPIHSLPSAARVLSAELSRRKVKPDCTLTGASDQRTRIALLAMLCGTGWRGGFTQASTLYHRPLTNRHDTSLIANNLRLTELLGKTTVSAEPRVFFSSSDTVAAQKLARSAGPEDEPLLIVVTQGSGGQRTKWHTDRFAEVIRHAHSDLGCRILYVGTAADTTEVELIRQAAEGTGTSLTGATSSTELAALLALSDLVLTVDTGTMHIGRAVEVPMVVLAPSWQNPIIWLPLQQANAIVLRGPGRTDIPSDYRLDEIDADQVISAIDRLLALFPPSAASRSSRLARNTSSVDHHIPS